ncbi:MAG: DUF4838 domain-containing protein [Oscillospiraceae bacterium]|nr:DUF4838 domain-containing protein [Oscillospiraceae bacterium]
MYRINKITLHPVVDFAAEELKKYLRMMMPECGEIFISAAPAAADGLRLGLMADFGLNTDEAKDPELDDILHIDTDGENGIIAGSNPRSVLLAVYRYLYENGCRWLFPGVEGECIPIRDVVPTQYHRMADCRYRGQCNEGAEYQSNMLEVIDFQPKLGMNVFMMEFDNPKVYYDCYFNANGNKANRPAEPITADAARQWKRQCEAELSKRGLQFHDMGHGWTAEPFGISSTNGWLREDDNPVPEEMRGYLAEVNGVRALWGGVALNTQFCMSNAEARTIVAKYIAEYACRHQNVDYLHVWLADSSGNHCECAHCRQKIPSDWYVMLLNEIDERLSEKGLATRIVFICYTDTTWAPETETIRNPDRFSMMLAAITRTYAACVPQQLPDTPLPRYRLNEPESFPQTVEEYILHAKQWKKAADVPTLVYEYHFWLHQYRDPGTLDFARLLHDDVKGYAAHGFDGLIQDGSQRSYFPTGYPFHAYAATLFDTNTDLDALREDYFRHAFGDIWQQVLDYFAAIGDAFDMKYLMDGADSPIGRFYSPAHAEKLRTVQQIADRYAPRFEEHRIMPMRAQTVSMRLLLLHLEYVRGLAQAWILKALGADQEAAAAFERFMESFGRHEYMLGTWFDQWMCYASLHRQLCEKDTCSRFD